MEQVEDKFWRSNAQCSDYSRQYYIINCIIYIYKIAEGVDLT